MFRTIMSTNPARLAIFITVGICPFAPNAAAQEQETGGVVMQGAPMLLTEDVLSEIASNKKSLDEQGYVDRPSEQSHAQFALSRIRERERAMPATNDSTNATDLSRKRGFYKVGSSDSPDLPFKVAQLPRGFVQADSDNYLMPLPHQVTRIFTKTHLGTVLVREIENATLYAEGPDAHQEQIGGFNVYKTTVRYADNQWATFILANKGRRVVQIEVGTRIMSQKHQVQLGSLVSSLLAEKQGLPAE